VLPDTPFLWDETVFESLSADVRLGEGITVRAGRQNLMRGEGFVLFDGTAGDGSRTAYFNAVDVTYAWKGSKLELIGIDDPHVDRFLPVLNDRHKLLQEWDEKAIGLYYTGREGPATAVDAYAFTKTETGDLRAPTNPQFQPDRRLGTLGARVARDLPTGLFITAEGAGQWGRQDANPATGGLGQTIAAWGGYAYARKVFDLPARPSLQVGWYGMSGDDPSTPARNEGWDPLFSRWPKWSELYIYSQVPEKGVSYWTNLGMWQVELLASPAKSVKVRATYYAMTAFHPFPGNPNVFGGGKRRGDLYQGRIDVDLGKGLKGHALVEHLAPGSFYAGRDSATFVRFELTYQFNRVF
jgi:hypothetical protein